MSSVRSARGVQVATLVAAFACTCVLVVEARRPTGASTWRELSAGLGIGSQAGVEAGWFAYDARLESVSEAAFTSPPGAAIGAGPGGGAFTLAPFSR